MDFEPTQWQDLIQQRISRRRLLQGGIVAAAAAGAGLTPIPLVIQPAEAATARLPFRPIAPSRRDDLVLPRGFRYDVVARFGDRISSGDTFGFNNDYTAYFPISAPAVILPQQRRSRVSEGLLAVNHEYVDPKLRGDGESAGPEEPRGFLAGKHQEQRAGGG